MCIMMHMCESTTIEVPDIGEAVVIHPEAVARAKRRLAQEPIAELAKVFAVVGDPTRLRVLEALRAGELCVFDIAAATGLNRTTVSHQLRVLREHRLVRRRREGKVLYYAVDDDHVEQLLAIGAEHLAEMSGPVGSPDSLE
jgi:ArsR family transcriptional regulator, lead/cadmium/zinc/bismuth-responsive transcriptional repressor